MAKRSRKTKVPDTVKEIEREIAREAERQQNTIDDEDAEYFRRADAVREALEGADSYDEMAILTMFLARWLSHIHPDDHEKARKDMYEQLEHEIHEWTKADCDS